MEFRLKTKSGQYRWFNGREKALWDDDGNPVRMSGSIQDIQERKSVEELLRKSEEEYCTLVESSQLLIGRLDQEGRFNYLNSSWEKTLGYTLEEMIGRPFTDFKNPDEAKRTLRTYKMILKGGSVDADKRYS